MQARMGIAGGAVALFIGGAGGALAAHGAAPARPQQAAAPPAAAAAAMPAGPGKDVFVRVCAQCHSPGNVIGHGQDTAGWTATLQQMVSLGAQGSDDDLGAILEYLVKNFPPAPSTVDINTARAIDLQSWLAFPQSQAEAIVNYRQAHGAIASLQALEQVPGIDPKLIQTHQAQLRFQP